MSNNTVYVVLAVMVALSVINMRWAITYERVHAAECAAAPPAPPSDGRAAG